MGDKFETFRSGLAREGSGQVAARESRQLRIDRQFVLFPINNESLPRRVRLLSDGEVLRSFSASLGLPAQWWAHLDVSDWQGETLTLSVEPDDSPSSRAAEIPGRGVSETDNAELLAAVRTSAKIWSGFPGTMGRSDFACRKCIPLDAYRPDRLPAAGDWVLVLEAR